MKTEEAKSPTTGEAFTRARAGYEFPEGKKLEPFNAMRQAAAANMGMRFGMVDEADIFTISVEKIIKKKVEKADIQFYNQLFSDVVMVMWLCSVPISRVLRVLRKVDEAKTEAFAWADKQGISLTSVPYFQAAGVMFTMMKDITVSTVIPVPDEGEGDTATDEGND
jgi:hypothetical protein